jgi:hypothetical protein
MMRADLPCQALAHSPQFHQQLATFGGALQTGQLDLAQFGLQAEVRDIIPSVIFCPFLNCFFLNCSICCPARTNLQWHVG